jgi:hypothetical protein
VVEVGVRSGKENRLKAMRGCAAIRRAFPTVGHSNSDAVRLFVVISCVLPRLSFIQSSCLKEGGKSVAGRKTDRNFSCESALIDSPYWIRVSERISGAKCCIGPRCARPSVTDSGFQAKAMATEWADKYCVASTGVAITCLALFVRIRKSSMFLAECLYKLEFTAAFVR